MRAAWATLEGIEGVGKTYLGQRLAARLGPNCHLISEVTDAAPGAITGQVISALSAEGDVFLRTGHPLTETFALLALKVREHEQLALPAGPGHPGLVLEDRGVETVGIYQAAILIAGEDLAAGRVPGSLEEIERVAHRIEAVTSQWRPPPDRILLLVDDVQVCVQRFSARIGRDLTVDEVALIKTADAMYERYAAADPDRITVIDRTGRTEDDTLTELEQVCADLLGSRHTEAPHA